MLVSGLSTNQISCGFIWMVSKTILLFLQRNRTTEVAAVLVPVSMMRTMIPVQDLVLLNMCHAYRLTWILVATEWPLLLSTVEPEPPVRRIRMPIPLFITMTEKIRFQPPIMKQTTAVVIAVVRPLNYRQCQFVEHCWRIYFRYTWPGSEGCFVICCDRIVYAQIQYILLK